MVLILNRTFDFLRKHPPFHLNRAVFLLLCGLLGALAPAAAQSRRAYVRAGDAAMQTKDFGAAIQQYGIALERKPNDEDLQWKYAECARQLHAYPLAEKMYRRLSADADYTRSWPLLDYRLGQVLKNQGQYEPAVEAFERFLNAGPDTVFADKARMEIASCRWAAAQPSDTTGVQVVNAGKKINSPYSDFAPYISGDTLFFSSYRFNKRGDRSTPRAKVTKVMFSIRNGMARETTRAFPNTDTVHIAHTAFAAEGHFLFMTLCKNINASDIRCEIWMAVQDIRKRWSEPVRLPEPVNLPGFTSTQPHVAYDTREEQLKLWFASDRPGGKGGLDLWSIPLDTIWFCPCNVPVDSRKPLRLPRFEDPAVHLDALNTPDNEATPFFHEPSQTLYFSSDGWPGYGGYDIFRAQALADGYAPPENVGSGLNSSYNDLYFTLRSDGKSGYLSSNRPGAQYLDEANKACCNDIFMFQYPPPPDPKPPLAAIPGAVAPRSPIQRPMIPIEQLQEKEPEPTPKLADFVGLPLYFDNDEPDKRTRRVRTQKTYAETVQSYLERQSEYRERFASGLSGSRQEAAETAIDVFFDQEVRRGFERLDQLCELLLTRLKAGEQVEIIIKGFTSPRAESEYNLALGKRRISSVRNYFEVYADAVLNPYIEAGALKITEASFGETTAREGVSDALADERNSIYHPDAARERRVEIVEIRAKE